MDIRIVSRGLWAGLAIGIFSIICARGELLPPRAGAAQPGGAAGLAVASPTENAQAEIEKLQRDLNALRKNMEEMERRLGQTTQTPTVFNTFERRIQEMQRDLDRLEREVDQRLRKLEEQVQRLERQSKG